jgi:uncharacterized protein YcfL
MKIISTIYLAMLCVAAIQGCQTNDAEPLRGLATNNPAQEMNSVRVLDDSLMSRKKNIFGKFVNKSSIVIEKEGIGATDTGLPEVWMVVRNLTDQPLNLEGRTTWFDVDKIPIDLRTSWHRFFVPPHSTETYRDTAVYSGAMHYQVDIRVGG